MAFTKLRYGIVDATNTVIQAGSKAFSHVPDGCTQVEVESWHPDCSPSTVMRWNPATSTVDCEPEAQKAEIRGSLIDLQMRKDAAQSTATATGYDLNTEIAAIDADIAALKIKHDAVDK